MQGVCHYYVGVCAGGIWNACMCELTRAHVMCMTIFELFVDLVLLN